MTANYYRSFLQRQLCHAVIEKQRNTLNNAIILHDNTRSHTAQNVKQQLECWEWEVLEHPPYSLDLSPWDFDFIPKVKELLHGRRFHTRDDIAAAVNHEMSKFIHGDAMVFDAFLIIGSGLWTLWGITLKVYEYGIF